MKLLGHVTTYPHQHQHMEHSRRFKLGQTILADLLLLLNARLIVL